MLEEGNGTDSQNKQSRNIYLIKLINKYYIFMNGIFLCIKGLFEVNTNLFL